MFDKLRAVLALQDQVGLGKASLHIAIFQVIGGLEVAGSMMLVQNGGIGLGCLFGVTDHRQRFIGYLDQLEGRFGNGFAFGSDQRNSVADIAHLVMAEHRPIDFMDATILAPGNIGSG